MMAIGAPDSYVLSIGHAGTRAEANLKKQRAAFAPAWDDGAAETPVTGREA